MQKQVRMNAVQVIVNQDLTVSYRLTLPMMHRHVIMFDDRTNIQSYIRNNTIRYYYVVESPDRLEILKHLRSAQLLINEQNISILQQRHEILLDQLSQNI